jgi:hypothetical protein
MPASRQFPSNRATEIRQNIVGERRRIAANIAKLPELLRKA